MEIIKEGEDKRKEVEKERLEEKKEKWVGMEVQCLKCKTSILLHEIDPVRFQNGLRSPGIMGQLTPDFYYITCPNCSDIIRFDIYYTFWRNKKKVKYFVKTKRG